MKLKRSTVIARLVDWANNVQPPDDTSPEALTDLLLTELERMEVVTIKWADEDDAENYCGAV